MNAVFLYSTQTVSTSQTVELLHFLKNRVTRSISLLYTFGGFLAKSLKITHLNLLLITEKAFQWTWLVEPRLWSSFTIIESFCVNQSIFYFICYYKVKEVEPALRRVLFIPIWWWRGRVDILFRIKNCEKKSTDKKKN